MIAEFPDVDPDASEIDVLILVLVEDGRGDKATLRNVQVWVLILVLVEDGRGAHLMRANTPYCRS